MSAPQITDNEYTALSQPPPRRTLITRLQRAKEEEGFNIASHRTASPQQQDRMSSPELPTLPTTTPTSTSTSRKHNRPDESPGDREGGAPQKLLRRRIACQRCRGRKVKCDNGRPSCGSCVESGRQCIYVDNGREKSPEVAIPPLLMRRLDQILAGVEGIGKVLGTGDPSPEKQMHDLANGFPSHP
ncbi:hypothetical protein O988_04642, partial [Pseudogymnoascus sp. VKM F-3808]